MTRDTAKLIVESGPQSGVLFDLPPGERVDIGRSRTCAVKVEGEGISRAHASVDASGDRFLLRDLDSRNGTYVNGERVDTHELASGDVIRIGEVSLKFLRKKPDPLIGRTLAGYRVEERLGRGGMGTVYRAVQVSMDRTVALKILSKKLSEDRAFVSRFVQEARSAARVTHPQVVQVHNVGHFEKLFYISMEFLPGGSVEDLIRREGRVEQERALVIAMQATRALMWAEKHGIVHRDIKPANLLIDASGRIKVADFGIAADIEKSKTLREGGMVVGSPEYMAPEQALGKPVDHRADIYGLGSTLYAALCGRAPFKGGSPKEIIARKVTRPPAPLTETVPDLPENLVALVAKMMALDPAARFQNAQEVYRALSAVLKAMQERSKTAAASGGEDDEEAPTPERRAPRPRRQRHKGLLETRSRQVHPVVVVGAVILVALALGWWAFFRQPRTETPLTDTGIRSTNRAPPAPRPKRTSAAAPSSGVKPAKETDRETPRRRALADSFEREIALLVLESRFSAALARLERFSRENPAAAAEVALEIERIRAAEALYNARLQAMHFAEQGEVERARAVLGRVLDRLPPDLKSEAELAIESLPRQ